MSPTRQSGLIPIFGGFSIQESFRDPSQTQELYKILKDGGCNRIDTGRIYLDAEDLMGNSNVSEEGFTIDTKVAGGFVPGTATQKGVVESIKMSLDKLKMVRVNIFYIHAFDRSLPLEETLAGIQDAYEAGYFKYFGLSNFTTQQVQSAYDICKSQGWILPTHFQGNYNPVARKIESDLLPLLRKLNICFYAYSPLAGGFLTKSKEQIIGEGQEVAGRFHNSNIQAIIYNSMYKKPSLLKSLEVWANIADRAGISRAELAFRWVSFHSALRADLGDAIVFGASRLSQVKDSILWIKKGPLDQNIVKEIDKVWDLVKDEAPLNNTDLMNAGGSMV